MSEEKLTCRLDSHEESTKMMKSVLCKAGLAETKSWDIEENALCVISAHGSQQCSLQ